MHDIEKAWAKLKGRVYYLEIDGPPDFHAAHVHAGDAVAFDPVKNGWDDYRERLPGIVVAASDRRTIGALPSDLVGFLLCFQTFAPDRLSAKIDSIRSAKYSRTCRILLGFGVPFEKLKVTKADDWRKSDVIAAWARDYAYDPVARFSGSVSRYIRRLPQRRPPVAKSETLIGALAEAAFPEGREWGAPWSSVRGKVFSCDLAGEDLSAGAYRRNGPRLEDAARSRQANIAATRLNDPVTFSWAKYDLHEPAEDHFLVADAGRRELGVVPSKFAWLLKAFLNGQPEAVRAKVSRISDVRGYRRVQIVVGFDVPPGEFRAEGALDWLTAAELDEIDAAYAGRHRDRLPSSGESFAPSEEPGYGEPWVYQGPQGGSVRGRAAGWSMLLLIVAVGGLVLSSARHVGFRSGEQSPKPSPSIDAHHARVVATKKMMAVPSSFDRGLDAVLRDVTSLEGGGWVVRFSFEAKSREFGRPENYRAKCVVSAEGVVLETTIRRGDRWFAAPVERI